MLSRLPLLASRRFIAPVIGTSLFSRSFAKAKSTPKAVDPSSAKEIALKNAIKQLEAQFGKGSVMKLGSKEKLDVPVVPTGSLTIDRALGIGGLPKGRVVEIYGPESSGKTTLALHVVAQLQKQGGNCTFIDAEHALDPVYASAIGVNIDDLYISQPDSGEQALEIADSLVRSGAMDMIVVDSVAALVPKAEAEGAMGDAHMALQARLMSQALRKLTGSLAKSNCLIIFINQIRQKVGIMFGNPEVTPGGNALKFYSSVRMDIRRKTAIKKEDEVIGYETTVKIVKNKLAPPFRVANFDMMFGTGISHIGEVLDLSIEEGLLEQSGAWISYNGENIAQGRPKAKVFLEQNPEICDELEEKLRAKWKEEKMNAATPASAINNTDSWKANGDIKEMYNDVKEEVEEEETSKSE